MDGTLFSTQELIIHCLNETSHKYLKRDLPNDDSLWGIGPPAKNLVRHFAESLPNRPIDEAVSFYDSVYRSNFLAQTVKFKGMPELLQDIRNSGRSLAIVTSETSTLSNYALTTTKLLHYFDALITSDHVVKRKPDPEGIYLALQKLQLGPRDCMVIGNSATDIIAGKKAGLMTGAALWGSETWGDPRAAKPDVLFSTIQDLSRFSQG
jgi:pyrophosphatase PpaX